MKRLTGPILALILSSCTVAQLSDQDSASQIQGPVEVGLCELRNYQSKYDKKLVKITAFAHFAFEDFSLMDPECYSKAANVWVEYGGKRAAGSMYCCGVSSSEGRDEPLEVQGTKTTLINDEVFLKFNALVHRPPSSLVRATLIGRFFASSQDESYGHMGCCSLFVLEKVERVDEQVAGLDWQGLWGVDDHLEGLGSYSHLEVPKFTEIVTNQQQTDAGGDKWQFSEQRKVVARFLERTKGIVIRERDLKTVQRATGREVLKYEKGRKKYFVTVSKPGWLSYYARDPRKVIWSVLGAVESPYVLGE